MIKNHLEKIILAAAIVVLGVLGLFSEQNTDEIIPDKDIALETEQESPAIEENGEIIVHITGAVKNPGIVRLNSGDRLIDAIKSAGGNTSEADIENVNLALKLEDEMKVHIPTPAESHSDYKIQVLATQTQKDSLININSATKEELMTLPNIGEIKAQKIIEYREEQPFKSIEDLKNVSGIGEKTFRELEEQIKVN